MYSDEEDWMSSSPLSPSSSAHPLDHETVTRLKTKMHEGIASSSICGNLRDISGSSLLAVADRRVGSQRELRRHDLAERIEVERLAQERHGVEFERAARRTSNDDRQEEPPLPQGRNQA